LGGFEYGLEAASNRDGKYYCEEEVSRNTCGNQSISQGQEESINPTDNGEITDTKDSDRALLQDRQESSNTESRDMGEIKGDIKSGQSIRQTSDGVLREGSGIRNDSEGLQLREDKSNIITERTNDLSKTQGIQSRRNEGPSPGNEQELLAPKQSISGTNDNRELLQRPPSENIQREQSNTQKRQNRFNCVGMSEWDKYSSQVLKYQFPTIKNWGDCTKINPHDLPDFDMLCGGFPCQAFSIAGNRRGFEDTRGTMFFEVARILKVKRPKTVLLENVKGLLNHNKGETFRTITEVLNSLGYIVNYEILNSKNFGVPQNRERVIITGWHINAIVEDGKTEKKSLLKRTILDYLFQLFLQNLKEVKKLQETKSKDWVLGYLILKEISRNPKLKEKSKKDGLTIPTEEKILELKEEDMWQNIALLLNNILEESYCELNKSTTSTATNETTDPKTYTYPELLMSILSLTVALRKSSRSSWKEMLSFLILIKENTKYARVIDKTENRIRTDTFNCYESRILQDAERSFIIGSLRGERRPQILPFGEDDCRVNESNGETTQTENICIIDSRVGAQTHRSPYIKVDGINAKTNKINQLNNPTHSNNRIYGEDGISPALNTAQGGNRQPKIRAVITPGRINMRQNGRRFKEDGEPSFTLTGQDIHGVAIMDLYNKKEHTDRSPALTEPHHNTIRVREGYQIRRLTPVECCRLQGFPDDWNEWGIDEKGNKVKMSDSQRYKQMGNAVTTNVIRAIGERLCRSSN